MAKKNIKEEGAIKTALERLGLNKTLVRVKPDNADALMKEVANNDPTEAIWLKDDVCIIPKDFDELIFNQKFNENQENPTWGVLLLTNDNLVRNLYFSTLKKRVAEYDSKILKATGNYVTANNDFYKTVKSFANIYQIKEYIKSLYALECTEVKTATGAVWKDGIVINTRTQQVPVFVAYATEEEFKAAHKA